MRVLATRDHSGDHPDTKRDLDLGILGAPAHTFVQFEREIRAEYAHVADVAFAAGRRDLLRGFLTRSEIHATPVAREELETRARENLERRIAGADGVRIGRAKEAACVRRAPMSAATVRN